MHGRTCFHNLQQSKHPHKVMARKNSANSWALLFVPLIVAILLSRLLKPLQLLFDEHWYSEWIFFAVSIAIGYFLYKRSRTVRDYEWRRQKAMQAVKGHIRAEDRGVWESEVAVPAGLGDEGRAALGGVAGSLSSERQTEEISDESEEVDVNLLMDEDHVVKATRRVTGDDTYDLAEVETTTGAVRKPSPMDRLIDWIGGKLAGKKTEQLTEEIPSEEDVKTEVPVSEPPQVEKYAQTPEPINPEVTEIYGSGSESIESLASLATPATNNYDSTASVSVGSGYSVNRCPQCGFNNSMDSRYCDQCGATL